MELKIKTPKLARLFEVWWLFNRLGWTSFGGPVAHLAYFRREFVERKGWLNDTQYAQILAICQFLPGPASSQVGFAIGLNRAGGWGALLAFVGFTAPSVLLLLLFVVLLPWFTGELGQAVLQGLKLVAVVVVADAIYAMSKKLCQDGLHRVIALAAAVLVLTLPWFGAQLLAVFLGGVLTWFFGSAQPAVTAPFSTRGVSPKVGGLLLIAFFSLLFLSFLTFESTLIVQTAQIFYRTGALVFGGGHVVLPWLQAELVPQWLSGETFLAGYGAAQALPGPLFTFAAYLGALMDGQTTNPVNALVALLFIFLPGFLLLAAVWPFWQQAGQNVHIVKAMTGMSASVVGLLAAAFLNPILITSFHSIVDAVLVAIGFVLLVAVKRSVIWLVGFCTVSQLFLVLM